MFQIKHKKFWELGSSIEIPYSIFLRPMHNHIVDNLIVALCFQVGSGRVLCTKSIAACQLLVKVVRGYAKQG